MWSDPITQLWTDSDRAIVDNLVRLVERYARIGDLDDPASARVAISLAAEIRLQSATLGLGPAERLRQRIRIGKVTDAAERRATPRRIDPDEEDPRRFLES